VPSLTGSFCGLIPKRTGGSLSCLRRSHSECQKRARRNGTPALAVTDQAIVVILKVNAATVDEG
jgi:hypothetical protein